MCKHFNDLSSKVNYSSSDFVVKKEIINYLNLTTNNIKILTNKLIGRGCMYSGVA